jgi:hypothetical protein
MEERNEDEEEDPLNDHVTITSTSKSMRKSRSIESKTRRRTRRNEDPLNDYEHEEDKRLRFLLKNLAILVGPFNIHGVAFLP